jgi:hypothetical protein
MSFDRTLKPAPQLCVVFVAATILAGCGSGGSPGGTSGSGGGTTAATLALSASPASLIVTASDAFFVTVTASESGTSATPTISLGTLPAGLTTTSTFPMSVPSGGEQSTSLHRARSRREVSAFLSPGVQAVQQRQQPYR